MGPVPDFVALHPGYALWTGPWHALRVQAPEG